MEEITAPPRYAIRVRGVLSETLLCAFPGLTAHIAGRDTVLGGSLRRTCVTPLDLRGSVPCVVG
jgi:hypothetical protein